MNNNTQNPVPEISYAKLGLAVFLAVFFSLLLAGVILGLIFARDRIAPPTPTAASVTPEAPPARVETPVARIIRRDGDQAAEETNDQPTEDLSEQAPVPAEPELPRVVIDDKAEAERKANAKRINIKTCNDWVRRYNVEPSSYNREMRNSACARAGVSIESGE